MTINRKRSIQIVIAMCAVGYFLFTCSMWAETNYKLSRMFQTLEVDNTNAELQDDLQHFFQDKISRKDIKVTYELLRKEKAQKGVSEAKYYAWVDVKDSAEQMLESGAVSLTPADNNHFYITHFVATAAILEDVTQVASVFPAPLVDEIVLKAKAH